MMTLTLLDVFKLYLELIYPKKILHKNSKILGNFIYITKIFPLVKFYIIRINIYVISLIISYPLT